MSNNKYGKCQSVLDHADDYICCQGRCIDHKTYEMLISSGNIMHFFMNAQNMQLQASVQLASFICTFHISLFFFYNDAHGLIFHLNLFKLIL